MPGRDLGGKIQEREGNHKRRNRGLIIMFSTHKKKSNKNIIGQWGNGDSMKGVTFARKVKEDFFSLKEVTYKLKSKC